MELPDPSPATAAIRARAAGPYVDLSHLFENDVFLSSQAHRRQALMPEERLMAAVLQDALACLSLHAVMSDDGWRARCRTTAREDALAWFASDDTSWPFSFRNICDQFDIDVDAARVVLFALQGSRTARGAGACGVDDPHDAGGVPGA